MNVPTFVVGTGRCGSTMLSNMLRTHPAILSISEFFALTTDLGGRIDETFTPEYIDGKAFFELIAALGPRSNLLVKHDVALPEFLYPFKSPQSRFSNETGVPAVLHITLPHLTSRFDELFDEIREYTIARPPASIQEHYIDLFNWLQQKFNKSMWIERSGGALIIIEQILEIFPDARFIHLVRDGRNCAISMSKHLGFRIFMLAHSIKEYLGVDPFESSERTKVDSLPPELKQFLPENFNREAFLEYQVPLSICGELWSQQIVNGTNQLKKLKKENVLTLFYEDLLKNPQASLHKLAAFLGDEFINLSWIEENAATVKQPSSSWLDLPSSAQKELNIACEAGFEALQFWPVKKEQIA